MLVQSQDVNVLAAEDPLGIVYHIQDSHQFWLELEDVIHIPSESAPTLSMLDSGLKRFMSLCASYHEQYLQSPFQLEHACELILDSELFAFHSERMCEILVDEAQSTTDPHHQLILYNILLHHGRRTPKFLRSPKRWAILIPYLIDHILVDIDPDVEDMYLGGGGGGRGGGMSMAFMIPIEAKLRSLGVRLLYEVCRVQKFSMAELRVFNNAFIDSLFDLVEQTREMQDETFNYSVIKLIVSLNEQFMVASVASPNTPPSAPAVSDAKAQPPESQNRVLSVLIRRLGASKTFGENMIFMLNRANRTAEDLCMQLLILKILYLLFTTKGTSEYFYTNDLCVLVDVFLRELIDLDEESESLRHTYLRVLHPLLIKTQLREIPYKRAQIVLALESLMDNADIRDIDPTTKRLVERCLGGEWCVQYRKVPKEKLVRETDRDSGYQSQARAGIGMAPSPGIESVASGSGSNTPNALFLESRSIPPLSKKRSIKTSKSVENLKGKTKPPRPPRNKDNGKDRLEGLRRGSNETATSLPGVAGATTAKRKDPLPASPSSFSETERHHSHNSLPLPIPTRADSLPSAGIDYSPSASSLLNDTASLSLSDRPSSQSNSKQHRRPAPPAPGPKRRKPPAVPIPVTLERTNSGATITAIASSNPANAIKVMKTSSLKHAAA